MSLEAQLRDIYAQHQELTPELVVATATDPQHPLHARFVWDDAAAGHQYRLVQAQSLIRSVKVELIVPERQEPIRVRAFVAERDAGGDSESRYLPTDKVLMVDGTRDALLRSMQRDVAMLTAKYRWMQEYADVLRAALADVA